MTDRTAHTDISSTLIVRQLGRIEYDEAHALQRSLHEQRQHDEIPDTLLLLEHPRVITMGKKAVDSDVLISEADQEKLGVQIRRIERGGETTYHGPGQLVGYLVFNLYNHGRRIKKFVWNLEESIIRGLEHNWGIESDRSEGRPGIWIGDDKICALGIAVKQNVTMHGFALNVHTDLDHFSWIVACGMADKGQTSIARQLAAEGGSVAAGLADVAAAMAPVFGNVYGYERVEYRIEGQFGEPY